MDLLVTGQSLIDSGLQASGHDLGAMKVETVEEARMLILSTRAKEQFWRLHTEPPSSMRLCLPP